MALAHREIIPFEEKQQREEYFGTHTFTDTSCVQRKSINTERIKLVRVV